MRSSGRGGAASAARCLRGGRGESGRSSCLSPLALVHGCKRKRRGQALYVNVKMCILIVTSQTPFAPSLSKGRSFSSPPQTRTVLRQRSEEHTSELQSLMRNSYAVFCLKKKNK